MTPTTNTQAVETAISCFEEIIAQDDQHAYTARVGLEALRAELTRPQEVAAEVENKDGPCQEADGCPTERAVLQRFWRQQNEPKNRAASRVPVTLPQEPVAWRRKESGLWVYYETRAWDDLEPLYDTPAPKQGDTKP